MSIDAGVRVGKYEVGRKLGQGGFGILHVARDHELGRDIAIKFLRPEHAFKPTVVQRFLQEARAAARINHPGIVTVFESGIVGGTNTRADGTVFIAMELLTGETLANRIKQLRPMPTALAVNYARQLASALGAAHQAGIVHRDLKPANVFLVPDSAVRGGERVKVLDFGIAKLVDDFGDNVQTHSMLMLGTPMYMSPEQCKSSAKVDARSDIYSLGCILFEMLCGQPPFGGDSGELIAKHQLVEPPTPRSLRGEVPAALDRLVTSMLAKSPDQRPQTMAAVDEALDDIADDLVAAPAGSPAIEDAPTQVEAAVASSLRARLPLLIGAAGAIAIGITVAVVSMGGKDKTPAAAAEPPVVMHDASVSVAVVTPPPVEPTTPIDAAPPTVSETVPTPAAPGELVLECKQLEVDQKWVDMATCAERLAKFDPATAKKLGVVARSEAVAQQTFQQVQDAVRDGKLDLARKRVERIDPGSVYRKPAEQVVADSRTKTRDTKEAKKSSPTSAACDSGALKDKGLENVKNGQHAAALAQFEASLRCKDDPEVVALAFMEACNASNTAKANRYFGLLDETARAKYKQICVRNSVKLASCNADELKDKGMEEVNMGQHAAALSQFEASLRCKNDPYVVQLAFMAACNAQNTVKAKQYYPKMSRLMQEKLKVMCVRNKISVD